MRPVTSALAGAGKASSRGGGDSMGNSRHVVTSVSVILRQESRFDLGLALISYCLFSFESAGKRCINIVSDYDTTCSSV